jgi:hypothetical protein
MDMTQILVISIKLRRLLLAEEGLENNDLTEADENDGDGDEDRPHHDAFVQVFGTFPALKTKRKYVKARRAAGCETLRSNQICRLF